MRKLYILSGLIVVIFLTLFIFYSTQWSFSANLKKYGFNKNNIIKEEGYVLDHEHLTKILLLKSSDKLAIIGLTNYGFGIWKDSVVEGSVENPDFGEFVTTGFVINRNRGINGYYEKHVLVASYIQNTTNLPHITGNSKYYLNVDYITINDKVILFAHAISGRYENIGSTKVISYLEENMGDIIKGNQKNQ